MGLFYGIQTLKQLLPTKVITEVSIQFCIIEDSPRFGSQNTNVCQAVLDPIIEVYKNGNKIICKLTNNVTGTYIYYSIYSIYLVQFGIKYTEPFEIPNGDLSLRTQSLLNVNGVGRSLKIHRLDLMKRL